MKFKIGDKVIVSGSKTQYLYTIDGSWGTVTGRSSISGRVDVMFEYLASRRTYKGSYAIFEDHLQPLTKLHLLLIEGYSDEI